MHLHRIIVRSGSRELRHRNKRKYATSVASEHSRHSFEIAPTRWTRCSPSKTLYRFPEYSARKVEQENDEDVHLGGSREAQQRQRSMDGVPRWRVRPDQVFQGTSRWRGSVVGSCWQGRNQLFRRHRSFRGGYTAERVVQNRDGSRTYPRRGFLERYVCVTILSPLIVTFQTRLKNLEARYRGEIVRERV